MKSLVLVLFVAASGWSQAVDCETPAACEAAVKANPKSSLAHFRLGEIYASLRNLQGAANQYREALAGDHDPKWIEVWCHINLGKIFDTVDASRSRALNEYRLAQRTGDNTRGALDEAARYLDAPYRP